jgi:hypothetical protein
MGTERWKSNWLAVSPPGAVAVDLGRSRTRRHARTQEVRALPAGTPVVLFASAPGAIRRCKAFATASGIALQDAYLAFPSAQAPAYLVEDDPAPLRLFVKTILAAPPRRGLASPLAAGLAVIRAFHPWRLLRSIAPGRVVVGRRR